MSYFLIVITAIFVNNIVLAQFLGICPFLGVSKSTKTAAGMGGAVVFVITLSSLVSSVLYKYIIVNYVFKYIFLLKMILVKILL